MAFEGPQLAHEVQQATEAVLERVLTALNGRVYSPRIRLLDINQICDATGMKKSAIYERIKDKKFPSPQRDLGKNLWRESAIIAWMDRNDPNLTTSNRGKE